MTDLDGVKLGGPRSQEFLDDYEVLRHGVGALALGRDVIRLAGPDALEYLQGQCSQDVAVLGVGSSADALLLSPQGKLDALVRVTRSGDDIFFVDVDAGYGAAVVARLSRFKMRVKAEITALDWTGLSLRGPDAASAVGDGALSAGTSLVLPFAWGGVVGVDLFGESPEAPPGVRPCSTEAWESIRVETGIPAMGSELDERTIAAEAGLLERCVSFTKGCYTGQELVARLDARGNKVARRLRGLMADPSADGVLRVGAEVVTGEKVVGHVTSAAWSPSLGSAVALAYLHRAVEPPSDVEILGETESRLSARALNLPLVA